MRRMEWVQKDGRWRGQWVWDSPDCIEERKDLTVTSSVYGDIPQEILLNMVHELHDVGTLVTPFEPPF